MKSPLFVAITDTHLSENTIDVNYLIFSQLIVLCKERKIGVIAHLGDVFTARKGQTVAVLNAWKAILDLLESESIRIIVIAGNHDKVDYTSTASYIDPFEKHPAMDVISPHGQMLKDDLLVHFLPYYDEKLSYRDRIAQIEVHPDKKNLLFTHIAIDGVKANSGIKVTGELEQSLFDTFDTVFVGHYHDRQVFGKNDQIVYIGSAYQANFGEDQEKGCTVINMDGSYEFVNFEFPTYQTISMKAGDFDKQIQKEIESWSGKEGKLRVKIEGIPNQQQMLSVAKLDKLGIRVVILKEDVKDAGVIQSQVKFTSLDIVKIYDEWSENNEVPNKEEGKKYLVEAIK